MQIRGPLNSQILKQKFPQVYRDFFAKCQLVVSCPHYFTWAGEYVGYFGGMMVLQKIPFRIYLGLEVSGAKPQERITFDRASKSYSLTRNKFLQDLPDHLCLSRLTEFINHYPLSLDKKQNIKVHFLSEMPFDSSGSAGALCSALSAALCLTNKKIKTTDIAKWNKQGFGEKNNQNDRRFNLIFRLAWKMLSAYRGRETSGATVFSPLLPSQSPLFYYLKQSKSHTLPLVLNNDYSLIDKIPVCTGRISDLFKLNNNFSWPIDFGLLYLGDSRGNAPYSTSQLGEEMRKTVGFAQKHFKDLLLASKNGVWKSNLVVMNFLSCQVLLKLGQVLKEGAREDTLRALLSAIDKHQVLFLLLGLLSGNADSVTSIIRQEAKRQDDLGAGLKSVSTTQKDVILFVLPQGRLRQVLAEKMSRIKKEMGIEIMLGYASWLDGIEQNGLKIEQDLEQNIYSDFVSKDTVFLTEFVSSNPPCRILLTPEEFEKKKIHTDIILQGDKIFIRGELATSKEIHSSKATCQLLKILLKNIGQEVSNRSLRESAYSQDRYEMQGKIIYPLTKTFAVKTKKKLPIIVKGSITDFSIKLEPGDFTIWLTPLESENF